MSGCGGVHGTQVSGDGSWMPHKWGGARTPGVWPTTSLTGMEEYADIEQDPVLFYVVLTWVWLVGARDVHERGEVCV